MSQKSVLLTMSLTTTDADASATDKTDHAPITTFSMRDPALVCVRPKDVRLGISLTPRAATASVKPETANPATGSTTKVVHANVKPKTVNQATSSTTLPVDVSAKPVLVQTAINSANRTVLANAKPNYVPQDMFLIGSNATAFVKKKDALLATSSTRRLADVYVKFKTALQNSGLIT